MTTGADMDKQSSSAANLLDRTKVIAELKKPSPKWPWVLLSFAVVMAYVFRTNPGNNYAIAGIFGASAGLAGGIIVGWILYLLRRVEVLTSLLLEQQDR